MIVASADTGLGLAGHRHDDGSYEITASAGGISFTLARIPEHVFADFLAQLSKGSAQEGHADRALRMLKGEAEPRAAEAELAEAEAEVKR